MATTLEQDKAFYFDMMNIAPANLLVKAVNWIGENLTPPDVFSYDQLSAWAADNGFSKRGKEEVGQ